MRVVTWMTRSSGVDNIIDTFSVPVSAASSSVCPGWLWPAACSASFFSGAVQIAWTSPRPGSACHLYVFVRRVAGCFGVRLPAGQVFGQHVEVDDVDRVWRLLGLGDRFNCDDLGVKVESVGRLRSRLASPMTIGLQ